VVKDRILPERRDQADDQRKNQDDDPLVTISNNVLGSRSAIISVTGCLS
jgi:hypothetical protein